LSLLELTCQLVLYGVAIGWAYFNRSIRALGNNYFGIVGAVAAVAVSDLPMYIVNVFASYREGLGMLRQDGLMTLVFIGTLVAGFAIRHALGLGLPFPGLLHV
jgi:hypothetical protein